MKRLWKRLKQSKKAKKQSSDDLRREASENVDGPLSLKSLALRRVLPTLDNNGSNGLSPLHVLCARGRADCLHSLLKRRKNANLNVPASRSVVIKREAADGDEWFISWWSLGERDVGVTPLHLAVIARSFECVRLLLWHGAKAHVVAGSYQETPLHYACLLGDVEIARMLLDHGAKVNNCPQDGEAPIHFALAHDHRDCVHLLLERGADPNIRAHFGVTALHHRYPGRCGCFAYGLAGDRRGDAPLHYAGFRGEGEMVELLLRNGANAKQLGGRKRTTVHRAAAGGSMAALSLLVESNAPVSLFDEVGRSPLHCALEGGHYNCAKYLLEHGADPNAVMLKSTRYASRSPPLMSALGSRRSTVECVGLLLSKGANVNFRPVNDCGNHSPLHLAVKVHGPDILRLLLASGADASFVYEDGKTILMEACESVYFHSPQITAENIRLLVYMKGMDLDHRESRKGRTALHICAMNGLVDAARVLLDAGANPGIINQEGLTPYQECRNDKTRAIFQEYAG